MKLQLQSQRTDSLFAEERFQHNRTLVTSRVTEAGGGLNLAKKWAKPNKGGPGSSSGPKTNGEVFLKKKNEKKKKDNPRIPLRKSCDGSKGTRHRRDGKMKTVQQPGNSRKAENKENRSVH